MAAPRRIAVLGCSGSGKSTLARAIAARLSLPCVETDTWFWTPDWRAVPTASVHARLADAVDAPAWVTDGNFDGARDVLWAQADMIVWLDLPLAVTVWRVATRNLAWWATRRPVWGGLRMTLRKALTGIEHTLRTHGQKRRDYPGFLSQYPTRTVVRLRSTRDADQWLTSL